MEDVDPTQQEIDDREESLILYGQDAESPIESTETDGDNPHHTIECLRDGDASECPKCKPINDKFRNQWDAMTPTEKDYYIGIIPE